MIPPPTKVGPWWRRRYLACYCMLLDGNNPHGWVSHYCPPSPVASSPTAPGPWGWKRDV